MSAANFYQPHVYLDGVKLAETRGSGTIATVADFKIIWGSNDWFDNIEPARLDLTLIDPTGSMIAAAASQPIEIRRDPDDTLVFRGTVEEVSSRYSKVTDADTGATTDAWLHTIKAYDPLHQLAKDRRRGPEYDARDINPYRLHWGPCYMQDRRRDLEGRISIPIAWQATTLDQYDGAAPILIYPVSAYERQQVVSVLTVLRNTARISNPLNRPVYFPNENLIRFIAATVPESALAPGYDALSNIRLRSAKAGVQLLDGSKLEAGAAHTLASTATEQVTRLELTMRTTRPTTFLTSDPDRYMENVETSQVFDIVRSAPSQMTIQAETDHSGGFWYAEPNTNATIAAGMALGPRYGAAKLAPFTYRFQKHTPAPAWALPFLNPAPPMNAAGTRPLGYQLIRAISNWAPHVSQFEILGGVLKYTHRKGWHAELQPSARGNGGSDPTLGNITMDSTLAQGGDESIIADWQHLDTALHE